VWVRMIPSSDRRASGLCLAVSNCCIVLIRTYNLTKLSKSVEIIRLFSIFRLQIMARYGGLL
jgi:hypothetical protein